MHPNIRDGEMITVEGLLEAPVSVGDVLLYMADRGVIAHRVEKIDTVEGEQVYFLRGDSAISRDKAVSAKQVLGKVVAVERHGRTIRLGGWARKVIQRAASLAFRLKQRAYGTADFRASCKSARRCRPLRTSASAVEHFPGKTITAEEAEARRDVSYTLLTSRTPEFCKKLWSPR